jgi:hypothetical protein
MSTVAEDQAAVMNPPFEAKLYYDDFPGVDILPEDETFRKFVPDESIQYFPLPDGFGRQPIRQLDS